MMRARVRCEGRFEKTNEKATIESGIAKANSP